METKLINTALKSLFLKKLDKMNNKALKLGMPPVAVEFGETTEMPCGTDTIAAYKAMVDGKMRHVALYTEVAILGDAPIINGWRLVAVVDLMGTKPVVKKVPFAVTADLTRFFDTDAHCDHCNTCRARKDVLVVQSVETDETMQIGRNCAADFFGTTDATQRLSVSDWIDSYGQGSESNLPVGEVTVSVRRIYEVAAACVRQWGWVHASDAKCDDALTSTKSRVWNNLFPWLDMAAEDKCTVTAEDAAEAEVVMAWLNDRFLSKNPADCTDFERNMQAVVEGEGVQYVRYSNINFLIWGIAGYKRDLQKDADERRRKMEQERISATAQYVGTIKDRRDFTMTLTFKRAFGSEYGVKYMQKFLDDEGNVLVWWGTNETAERTIVGERYTLKATIKDHQIYGGCKQTVLTRATLVEGVLKELEDC